MAVTIVTINDEVLSAMNFNTTTDSDYTSAVDAAQTYLKTALLRRLIQNNVIGAESGYSCELRGSQFDFDGGTPDVYQMYIATNRRYEYWLSPSFTVEGSVDYTLNANGSIDVTSATTDSRSVITVSAVPVNFAMLMVDIFRYLGNHYSRVIAQSVGAVSVTPSTVRQELMRQATHWATENGLYMGA